MTTADLEEKKLGPGELTELAARIGRQVESAVAVVADLKDRWDRNMRLYRNDPPATSKSRKRRKKPNYHVNLTQPKLDTKAALIMGTVFGQEPFVLCKGSSSSEPMTVLEQTVQKGWEQAEMVRKTDVALPYCFVNGLCPVRQRYDDGKADYENEVSLPWKKRCAGLRIEPIHPANFCVYPSEAIGNDLDRAQIVGHRFYQRQAEIKAKQEADVYITFDTDVLGNTPTTKMETGFGNDAPKSSDANADPEPQDRLVECWDILVLHDFGDGERRYAMTLARDPDRILRIEDYSYGHVWYHTLRVHEELEGYWNEDSEAQKLQGPQLVLSEVFNMVLEGIAITSKPPVFGSNMPESANNYEAGQVVSTDGPPNTWTPGLTFSLQGIPLIIDILQNAADAASNVSQAGTAQQFKSGTTATEASLLEQAQATGNRKDVTAVGYWLISMWKGARELLWHHFDDWKEAYGEGIPAASRTDLELPVDPIPHGRNPGMTPASIIKKLESFLALLQGLAQMPPQIFQQFGVDPSEIIRLAINQYQFNNAEKIMPALRAAPGASAPEATGGMLAQIQQALANGNQANSNQQTGAPGAAGQPGVGGGAPIAPGGGGPQVAGAGSYGPG